MSRYAVVKVVAVSLAAAVAVADVTEVPANVESQVTQPAFAKLVYKTRDKNMII